MKVDYAEAKRLIEEENAQFVDVRTPKEFAETGIEHSTNLPLQELYARHAEILDNDQSRPIILFCRSGNRSDKALKILARLGYENIYDMGSYREWKW